MNKSERAVAPSKTSPVRNGSDPELEINLSLSRLDWASLVLGAAILAIAPIFAGQFASSSQSGVSTAGVWVIPSPLGCSTVMIVTAIATAVVLIRERLRPVAICAVPGLVGLFGLAALWALIGIVKSPSHYLSLNALSVFVAALLLGGILSRLARTQQSILTLLVTIISVGAAVGCMGVREYIEYWKLGESNHRSFSTFVNPDFLAGYLLLVLPITLSAFVGVKERTARLAAGTALIVQSACLLLTGSRAGAGLLLVSVVIWLSLMQRGNRLRDRVRHSALGVGLVFAAAMLASFPTLKRVAGVPSGTTRLGASIEMTAAQQGHSAAFRQYTWSGAAHMVSAHPINGLGIGTFEVTYPRFAETAFTAHAHNGYLQWMAETGAVGAVLVMGGLAAGSAFVAGVVLLTWRKRPLTEEIEGERSDSTSISNLNWPDGLKGGPDRSGRRSRGFPNLPDRTIDESMPPDILMFGLICGLAGCLLHNLFDSDWYVVGTLITIAGVIALLIGVARRAAPLTPQAPRPMGPGISSFGAIAIAFLLWRGVGLSISAIKIDAAQPPPTGVWSAEGRAAAAETLRSAVRFDPFNPEPNYELAMIDASEGKTGEGLRELRRATQISPIGRTFYHIGQYEAHFGQTDAAVRDLEQARQREPSNIQNLNLLGATLFEARRIDQAASIYHQVTALELTPYGRIRAIPEMVETDFGIAHLALGKIAADSGKWDEAETEFQSAERVFADYWSHRNVDLNQNRSDEKKLALESAYNGALEGLATAFKHLGRTADAVSVAAEEQSLQADIDADRKAMEQSLTGSTP